MIEVLRPNQNNQIPQGRFRRLRSAVRIVIWSALLLTVAVCALIDDSFDSRLGAKPPKPPHSATSPTTIPAADSANEHELSGCKMCHPRKSNAYVTVQITACNFQSVFHSLCKFLKPCRHCRRRHPDPTPGLEAISRNRRSANAAATLCVGDVHADCDRMLQLLTTAKLIAAPAKPATIRWTGGNANLVLVGDMIDKYNQSLAAMRRFEALEPQVLKAGGHLVICLGNHEAEFLAAGGDSKKSTEFAQELKVAGMSSIEVAAGRDKDGLGEWLRTRPLGARIGDWFFCHAGNTGGMSVAQLESELEMDLAEKGYATPFLMDPNSMLEARMHPRAWFAATANPQLHDIKKQSKPTPANARQTPAPPMLAAYIADLGVRHLVIAHQPGKIIFDDGVQRMEGEMFSRYDGLFFMIDTGMSRGVSNGRAALLQIQSTPNHITAAALYSDGKTAVLWRQ